MAALVLLMMNAEAVPWLVKVKEVGMERPLAKVKAMFRPFVVVMVLPALYTACRPKGAELQYTTSFELLVQRAVVEPTPFWISVKATRLLAVMEPLKVADPVPTVNEFAPVIDVFPLMVTAPVPVVKVPLPFWVKLPDAWV